MKIICLGAISLLAILSCNNVDKETKTDDVLPATPEVKTEPASDPIKSKSTGADPTGKVKTAKTWVYDTARGKSNGVYTPSVYVLSDKNLELKTPYEGVNPGKLIIMKNHGVTNLIIAISKGKFSTDDDGKPVRARFDGADFETYECTKSNNGDPTMLFVDNSDKFIKKLKAAKKVTIEAEIQQNGMQTMEFDVERLNWE